MMIRKSILCLLVALSGSASASEWFLKEVDILLIFVMEVGAKA